ncbi:Retrovirus-related Pol polyprotein from transposon TNT 1-94 [Phytophthora cinnamomi]|uniref:Retrovirus-related Pol polyprotein from transposon TNT 1-94 n=1 Tax=Phytophthora cinnamomi TaxID=4785 RepID=UPI003559C415|nr:Retrovirus-related Pol polyprotein from transposon TNT 1-94 [Phytophthora cinnamomi]
MQVTARDGYTSMANIVVEPFHLEMVYPLREKSSRAQLDAVKECIAKLKAYSPSHSVAFIKSDNAAEYVGGEFAAFCDKHEIVEEFSTTYIPQQNGKVERGNRVVVEMARSIMLGANLPMVYWADAVVCAAYVQSRCPTKVLDVRTPMEALLGTPPDISNLRDFGCKVQALVPKEHRKTLDSKPSNGIFIGFATGGAYLVHIPHLGTGETITARTVVFYEDQFLPPSPEDEITTST